MPPKEFSHSIAVDETVKRNLAEAREMVDKLRQIMEREDKRLRGQEGKDEPGNFDIQGFMSDVDMGSELAAEVLKKLDEMRSAVRKQI